MTATAETTARKVRLSAIVATAKTAKGRSTAAITEAHRDSLKAGDQSPLVGLSRVHRTINDTDTPNPPQKTLVQYTVEDLIARMIPAVADAMDVIATQEVGNADVRANVELDGVVLIPNVPVGYLLYLDRLATDLHTFVTRLPTVDPSEKWDWNENAGLNGAFASEPRESKSTTKVPRNHVLHEAVLSPHGAQTVPPQVEVYYEDVISGIWTTMKFSGALKGDRKRELVRRVERFQKAIKVAREEANSAKVDEQKIGERVLGFLFA